MLPACGQHFPAAEVRKRAKGEARQERERWGDSRARNKTKADSSLGGRPPPPQAVPLRASQQPQLGASAGSEPPSLTSWRQLGAFFLGLERAGSGQGGQPRAGSRAGECGGAKHAGGDFWQ